MPGRQIRWARVGRIAAIAAAGVLGIASLPALLGGDAPPPVPPDVGLAPPISAISTTPIAQPSVTPAAPSLKAGKQDPRRHLHGRRRGAKSHPPRHKLSKHPVPAPRRDRHEHPDKPDDQVSDAPAPPISVASPPYSYPAPTPGEFHIER